MVQPVAQDEAGGIGGFPRVEVLLWRCGDLGEHCVTTLGPSEAPGLRMIEILWPPRDDGRAGVKLPREANVLLLPCRFLLMASALPGSGALRGASSSDVSDFRVEAGRLSVGS